MGYELLPAADSASPSLLAFSKKVKLSPTDKQMLNAGLAYLALQSAYPKGTSSKLSPKNFRKKNLHVPYSQGSCS